MKATLQRTVKKLFRTKPRNENLMYRVELFGELKELAGQGYFREKRILEIGPKDGMDSQRLASLSPKELVMIDLPEKREENDKWLRDLKCPHRYIEGNFMYLPKEEYASLGTFDLIWCTGVLYHNAEQMRFLRKLYQLTNVGGYLVMESATLRLVKSLKNGCFVQIHYPETYKNTGTITHMPTAGAIKAWLQMVGYREIHDSHCYEAYDRKIIGHRYACVSRKNAEDESDVYYGKSGLNPGYPFGSSN